MNDHSTADSAAVTSAQPVMLLRYQPGVARETARTVHLVPLPPPGQPGAAGVALCGAVLCPDQVETVTPGLGMPCLLCVLSQVSAGPPRHTGHRAPGRHHQQRHQIAGGCGLLPGVGLAGDTTR
ncbi:MAG: hypothetical protein ACRDUV_01200 [Pseudonocardiaceae bacterium]